MKINPILNPNIIKSYAATKPVAGTAKAASGRDEVTFSKEALEFSKALAEARDALELRTPEEQSHIADITNAVGRGDYWVSSNDIAGKILESVLGKQ